MTEQGKSKADPARAVVTAIDTTLWGDGEGNYGINFDDAVPIVARAIQAAKAEAYQESMNALQLMVLQHGDPGAVAENPYVDLRTAIAAIRKRSEA